MVSCNEVVKELGLKKNWILQLASLVLKKGHLTLAVTATGWLESDAAGSKPSW